MRRFTIFQFNTTALTERRFFALFTMRLNRFTASGLHLVISAGIAISILLGMKLVWYPDPYFEAIEAGRLILILVAVDVIIGPLITLIIYNQKKPGLKRDLLIVVFLQTAALVYGMYAVFIARPVYAVFNVDRFDLVVASEIDPAELKKAERPEFKSLPLWGPQIIAAKLPLDEKELEAILLSSVRGGADVQHLPKYYVPYTDMMETAKRKAMPLAILQKKAGGATLVDRFIANYGHHDTQLGFVPFRGRKKDFSVVLELNTGKVAGFLLIDPY